MDVENVWSALVDQQLCTQDQIAKLRQQFEESQQPTTADNLTGWLIEQTVMTPYQAKIILGESTQPLRIGPYEILLQITQGRLAGMYRAQHYALRFPVCLKLLQLSGDHQEQEGQLIRFQRESRVSVQVTHPHVVRTFQIGQVKGSYFIALENLKGQSLLERMASSQAARTKDFLQLDTQTLLVLAREVSLGLKPLHDQGIIHRDITPNNIWVTEDGHAKILDFGLARDALSYLDDPNADQLSTGGSEFLGNTDYLSPEQAVKSENASPATDIYSLGCTLYHALTGQVPFEADSPAKQMILHAGQMPAPPSELNPELRPEIDELVLKMMAKDPAQRFSDAGVLASELVTLINAEENILYHEEATSAELVEFLTWIQDDEMTLFSANLPDPDDTEISGSTDHFQE